MRHLAVLLALSAAAAGAEPAAWHVSDGRGELWLLGSVHYLRAQDYPLPPIVDELYARADALVMELDLDDLDPAALQTQFLGAAMLPPGDSLAELLGAETYAAAVAHGRELGVDLRLLDQFEPWLVAITLMDLGMAQLDFRPQHGIEQYLLRRARSDDKPVFGLETLQSQIGVFDALSAEEQQALLEQTLQELDTPSSTMLELVSAWRDGRLEELAAGLLQDFDQFPKLYETLVVARNRSWIAPLQRYLSSPERHFVIVGALHLVGPDSVIDLLEARGLSVTPVD